MMLDIIVLMDESKFADFTVGFSKANIIVVPSSVFDCPLVMEQTDQNRFIDEVLNEEGNCYGCQPK
jgi:hypothetical protein